MSAIQSSEPPTPFKDGEKAAREGGKFTLAKDYFVSFNGQEFSLAELNALEEERLREVHELTVGLS